MTKDKFKNSDKNPILAKRKKVLAAVAKEAVGSEDENISDGMCINSIIAKHSYQLKRTADSCSLRALGETIRNTLFEINEVREQIRERRHQELLQMLAKLIQPERTAVNTANTRKTNADTGIAKCNYTNINSEEQGFLEIGDFSLDGEDPNFTNNLTENSEDMLNKKNQNSKTVTANSSSKKLKLLPKSQISKQQIIKSKRFNTVEKDGAKNELEIMRARMLEIQRKKMEDRERKKRDVYNCK